MLDLVPVFAPDLARDGRASLAAVSFFGLEAPLSAREGLAAVLRCDFGRGRFVVTLGRATADLAGNQLRAATGRRLTVVR